MEGPVRVPDLCVSQQERMLIIGPNAFHIAVFLVEFPAGKPTKIDGKQALAVRFVSIESNERQGADIDLFC